MDTVNPIAKVSVRALIIIDGKALLVKPEIKDLFHFPGGKPNKNETLKKAVIRESLEETGIVIHAVRLVFKLFQVTDVGEHEQINFYRAIAFSKIKKTRARPGEIKEIKFMSQRAILRAAITDTTRQAMLQVQIIGQFSHN